MSKRQINNLLIIESMFMAGLLIAIGVDSGYWVLTMIGFIWNCIVLTANCTVAEHMESKQNNNHIRINAVILEQKERESNG